jgi:hypothetical protein
LANAPDSVQLYDEVMKWLGFATRSQTSSSLTFEDYCAEGTWVLSQPVKAQPWFHTNYGNLNSQFFSVLDLDRTRGQLAGYNTVDDTVDLQMLLTLNPINTPASNNVSATPSASTQIQPSYYYSRPKYQTGNNNYIPPIQSILTGAIPYGVGIDRFLGAPVATASVRMACAQKALVNSIMVDCFTQVDQIFQVTGPLQAVILK